MFFLFVLPLKLLSCYVPQESFLLKNVNLFSGQVLEEIIIHCDNSQFHSAIILSEAFQVQIKVHVVFFLIHLFCIARNLPQIPILQNTILLG